MLDEYLNSSVLPDWALCGFESRARALERIVQEHRLEILVWEATRRCDLTCRHCGSPYTAESGTGELSTAQVIDLFSRFDEAFDLRSLTCISITGGEPTVRQDLPQIVEHVRALGASQIVMHTNGHRIVRSEGLLGNLVSAGITGIGVNLDGMQEAHNWLRNDPAAFELSLRAFTAVRHTGIDTMVSTVLTRRVLDDLPDLRSLMIELQPMRWRLLPIEPIGRASNSLAEELLTPRLLRQVVEFVLESRTEHPEINIEMGCGQWYGKRLETLMRPYIWYCIAGVSVMGIMYDGTIGACNNISHSYSQGNALHDDLAEVWRSRFLEYRERDWCHSGECDGCEDWRLCRGGEMHLRGEKGQRLAPCFFSWLQQPYEDKE
ncbi:MAG TPA: radical SAM protein [Armatimonadota bacterium]|nr:radical SAM protein [Armatimonadota bacterium]